MVKDKTESKTVGARLTKKTYDRIVNMLKADSHVSISDYIRDLVRRDLETKGLQKEA